MADSLLGLHPISDVGIIERLETLWLKLDAEGLYVSANTVGLAIDRIKQLTTASQSDAACPSDDRHCADCGYPVGDKPVFLGGVWFCATCNPAISLLGGDIES